MGKSKTEGLPESQFANQFGYDTMAEMKFMSYPAIEDGDITWWATPSKTKPGQWIAWDDAEAYPGYVAFDTWAEAVVFHEEAWKAEKWVQEQEDEND